MKKKKTVFIMLTGVVLAIAVLLAVTCKYKTYDYPLNTLTSIKYFEPSEKVFAYRPLTLTPVKYSRTPFSQTVVAKAIYQEKTIGIEISISVFSDKITFKSIGQESENFLQALSGLYEEETGSSTIRQSVEGFYMNHGNHPDWDKEPARHKAGIKGLDGKEADLYFDVDIPEHEVILGDRHNGLAKKRFVNAFKNNQNE